jgi:hypothetical protein
LMPLRGPPGVVVDAPWAGDPDVGRVVSAIQSSANPKRAKQAESLASETVAAGLGSTPGGPSSLGLRQAEVPAMPSPTRRSGSPFFVAVGRRQNRRVPRRRRRSPKAVAAAFPLREWRRSECGTRRPEPDTPCHLGRGEHTSAKGMRKKPPFCRNGACSAGPGGHRTEPAPLSRNRGRFA